MFNVKFYVSAIVGVIMKVILQNARCNNKDSNKYICEMSQILALFYDFLKIFIHIDTLKNKYSLFKI